MNIDRRQLALPALALGLLAAFPAFAGADEERSQKTSRRSARPRRPPTPKAFASLCAAELSYSHSGGAGRGQGDASRRRHQRKIKLMSLEYKP